MAQPSHWSLARRFHRLPIDRKLALLFYLVSLGAATLIGLYGYRHAADAYRSKAADLVSGYVGELAAKIEHALAKNRDDLRFLARLHALQRYVYWLDIGDQDKMAYWQGVSADTLRDFSAAYGYHRRIAFIDSAGRERVAVRRDPLTGVLDIVPDGELREHAGEPWLAEALALGRGAVSAAPVELSAEGGRIETPHIPVVRFASPVIGDNGVRYGTVVATTLAASLYGPLESANRNDQGREFHLTDAAGQYLYHPDRTQTFGHRLGHGAELAQEHPDLPEVLATSHTGIIQTGGHVHAFRAVYPDPQRRDNRWNVIGGVDEGRALTDLNDFIAVFAGLIALVLAGVLAATRYMQRQLLAPLGFVTRQLQRLSRGQVTAQPEALDYPADDEIRRMVDSSERLVASLRALATQADAIAGGDLSGQVIPLSADDRLGLALDNMTRMLRQARAADLRRDWLRDGLAQLSHALTGDLEPERLAELAIAQVGRYLGAGRGVLYVWDREHQFLALLASYMYTERNALGSQVALGEGAVGQAAREKKPIVLCPGDAATLAALPPITTGTVNIPPRFTYTWPLLRDDTLHGVLEVACAEALTEPQRTYLDEAVHTIASFLHAALQRRRITELLKVAEATAQEAREQSARLAAANTLLEGQQHQLQQSNAQLEEQQQQLQQQTEELQQSNTQMEEQQQQLQQQAEELRLANEQMRAQQRLLEQQAAELEARNRALEQASRYKSDFLANMSHELRTPLNSIILLAKMLSLNEGGHLDTDEVKRARVIHHAGNDLLLLINDILDLSKIEAGKMDLHPQPVDSGALVEELRGQFEDTARAKGLVLHIDDRWAGPFTTDRDKLMQVLRNLLSNALKFTREGSVAITLRRSEEPGLPLCIAVSDTGIGIPEDKLQVIFDAFQQVDSSISRQFGGTGLGLSISRHLARLLGGAIRVSSTLGQGSEFRLLLPQTTAEPVAVPVPVAVAPAATVPAPAASAADDRDHLAPGDEVILVVDDDPDFGAALAQINRGLGCKTLLAGSGGEGLHLAERYRPSGILLDLGLPDMDGGQVLRTLKSNRELRHIPVYIVSAADRAPQLLHEGIVGYLRKPVDDERLIAAEHEVLALAGAGRRLLVVEGAGLTAAQVRELVAGEEVEVAAVPTEAVTTAAELGGPYALALVGLDAPAGLEHCLATCKALGTRFPHMPVMVSSRYALGGEEEAALRAHTDSVVVPTAQAGRRMLTNIERFLSEARGSGRLRGAPAAGARDRLAGRRILVVDDDARNLFVVTSALEQQGARVENALNGRKALELLRREPVDLVFMDIMMPDMDGYEAIAAIKTDPALKATPVVALTAKALKDDRRRALEAGADDYLAKPVDYEVLINLAAAWCGKGR